MFQEGDESIVRKYKDNGDGSYTEYVEASVTVGDVTVSGGLTDAELRATPVPVVGPLTDAQIRATPLPIDGTVVVSGLDTSLSALAGGLTDTQLRASDIKVSLDGESVSISPNTFLGEEVVTGNGSNQNATVPSGTSFIWATAESGIGYASTNAEAAPTTAGWYIPQDATRIIGPFSNLTSLGVYAVSGVFVHLVYGN